MESILFDEVLFYDTLKTGITVSVILKFGEELVDYEGKLIQARVFAFLSANTPKD